MKKQKQKEQLPLRIAKTVLAIAIITGLGTIIFGGGVVIMKYYNSEVNNKIAEPVDWETENYYDILEKKCGDDSCCLSSLNTMREHNYKKADENGKCPDNFRMNMMRCITSYQWCEPMEEIESEVVDFKVESHQTFSYDGASMAMDCKFLYGEVRSGKFESKKLLVYFPDYTTYPNYLKIDEYIEKDATIKVFLTNNKSILRNKFDEIYGENYGGEFPYYCLEDEDMDNNKKNDYVSQEIFALKMPDEENQIDTSDWQTYRNEEFGFEMKYPKDWLIPKYTLSEEFLLKEKDPENWLLGGIYITPPYRYLYSDCYINGCVHVVILHNPRNFSIEEFYEFYAQEKNQNIRDIEAKGVVYNLYKHEEVEIEQIRINNIPAVKFSKYPAIGAMVTVSIPYKNVIIELILKGFNSNKETAGEKEKILMEIVNTFKFIEK